MRCWSRFAVVGVVALAACAHDLQVKNIGTYQTAFNVPKSEQKLNVGIRPFTGTADDLFFFNTLVEKLSTSPAVDKLVTDASAKDESLDVIFELQPSTRYRSSAANFFINFPGFIIFTPAWNGYVYRAEILTDIKMTDGSGEPLGQLQVPVSYNLRHADFNRTIFTGLTWLEVGVLALGGGIYNAIVFDRDAIAPLQLNVKDNYAGYVMGQMSPKLREAAIQVERRAAAAAAAEQPVEAATQPQTQE